MERVPRAHRQQRAADAGMAAAELAVFPCSLKGGAVRLGKNTPEPAEERREISSFGAVLSVIRTARSSR